MQWPGRSAVWIAGALAFVGLCWVTLAVQAAPDEDKLGKREGYPIAGVGAGKKRNWYFDEVVRVGSFTHQAEIPGLFHGGVNELKRSPRPLALPQAPAEPAYRWGTDRNLTIDDFLARQRIMGLLIVKDGVIQVERYQYERKPSDHFTSHSMAKSITSLAVGIAFGEGKIASLDDRADKYATKLRGGVFGETTIRNLLRMAVGAKYQQGYNQGEGDTAKFWPVVERTGIEEALASFVNERERPQGEKFYYVSPATLALAAVVQGATRMSLSEYLSPRLWQAIGAEGSATWRTDRTGLEVANGNFNATLRDYARLGIVLANDGVRPDDPTKRAIVPREYLLDATDERRAPEQFRPGRATPYLGYGYQFWLYPGKRRRFVMLGVFGQSIFVDPDIKLVIVQTAANQTPEAGDSSLGRERDSFWRGILRYYD
ncbi:MAG TPA: serine hydrolase [Burkholderiaceae bacterium]|nr:serine hydrolase [Burkholderiaceae bacterium]